jgi:hypothetical protein
MSSDSLRALRPPATAYRRAARRASLLERRPLASRPTWQPRGVGPSRFGVSGGDETPVQRTQMLDQICIGMHLCPAGYQFVYGHVLTRAAGGESPSRRRGESKR